jgi:hypothetical protein
MKKALMAFSLLIIFGSSAFSQDMGLKSITAKAGILMPESPWDTGFQVGAKADFGQIANDINLVPFVEYWSSGYDLAGFGSLDMSNIKLGASAHYAVPSVKGLYAEAGLALNFLSIDNPSFTVFGITSGGGSTSDTKFGAVIVGGYELALGSMNGVIEAEYNLTDLSAFEISFGIKFDMAK